MTVDESSVSPSQHPASKPKVQAAGMAQQAPNLPRSFEEYLKTGKAAALQLKEQLREISGVVDDEKLHKAFNETRFPDGNFNIARAIDWILNDQHKQPSCGTSSKHAADDEGAPAQRPNSPNNPAETVDLTESSPKVAASNADSSGAIKESAAAASTADADLEKAIQLSLQEANRTAGFGGGSVTQEDQDVSRALEASLLDSQLGTGKRKRGETWIDPLNPHDRERNGLVRLFFSQLLRKVTTT